VSVWAPPVRARKTQVTPVSSLTLVAGEG